MKDALKWVFGRPFPETYLNPEYNNYGYHWFAGHGAFTAFPSGHMAGAVAVASVLWIADPPRRILYTAACVITGVGLVVSDLHFVGDVVAGAFLGAAVGRCTAYFMREGSSGPEGG
jgi:membrane-associated phospholipid phosphatase